jgi:hypothetical protein
MEIFTVGRIGLQWQDNEALGYVIVTLQLTLEDHIGAVSSMAFSPDDM